MKLIKVIVPLLLMAAFDELQYNAIGLYFYFH